jgi:tRNA(Ile)-lysidine synthase
MIRKVKETIKKYEMLQKGDLVIVAVSGGADSIVLLEILERLSIEYEVRLVVGHLNHEIRYHEANKDEKFVERIAKEKGIPFESKHVNIPLLKKNTGRSIEDIAREERYQFLFGLAKKHKAKKIALGHNFHDQIETIILNFLRGSGSEGLRGMNPIRDGIIIRPLLYTTRKEICEFIKKEQLSFVVDETNAEDSYLRNRIRHNLIPTLKQYNPNIEMGLSRMSDLMRIENEFLNSQVMDVFAGWRLNLKSKEIRLDIKRLLKYQEAIQNRIIKFILHRSSGKKNGFSYIHVNAVKSLLNGNQPSTTRVSLPFGVEVIKENDDIVFNPIEKDESFAYEYDVHLSSMVNLKELGIEIKFDMITDKTQINFDAPSVIYMDYEDIDYPLKLRNFRNGDRIQPLGMHGTKKVKSYFIDKKIPRLQRKKIPLLVDQQSVIWIAGMAISDRVKIKAGTKKILKIEIV